MDDSLKHRWILISGAVLAMFSVIIGAFSSHALKSVLDEYSLTLIETGSRYQMYHALAILTCGILIQFNALSERWLKLSAYLFTAGAFIFCGALYAIALSGVKLFGAVAPIGGTAFILGWLALIIAIVKSR